MPATLAHHEVEVELNTVYLLPPNKEMVSRITRGRNTLHRELVDVREASTAAIPASRPSCALLTLRVAVRGGFKRAWSLREAVLVGEDRGPTPVCVGAAQV